MVIKTCRMCSSNRWSSYDAVTLTKESSVRCFGVLKELPEGKTAPDGHEMTCDYWEIVGRAPAGGLDNLINAKSKEDQIMDNGHAAVRLRQKVCVETF